MEASTHQIRKKEGTADTLCFSSTWKDTPPTHTPTHSIFPGYTNQGLAGDQPSHCDPAQTPLPHCDAITAAW